MDSNIKKVIFDKNPACSSEIKVSSKPTFSSSDSHLDVLEILEKSGAIQVIYPKQGSGNLVSSPTSAVTYTEIKKYTIFGCIFLVCSQIFSQKFGKCIWSAIKMPELICFY